MKNFNEFVIRKDENCLDALRKLDRDESHQTLFVIDNSGKMTGTVTDGDIRRGLIKGLKLTDPISSFSFPNFSYINDKIDVLRIKRLKNEGIKLLPKLNKAGQIVKVFDLCRLKSILPVHAFIMAGGKGDRLRPLTENVPKPMLLLGSKPILEHIIDNLITYGIENITISVRYLAEQIIQYFGDGKNKNISIDYIKEDDPLGTIGCLSQYSAYSHANVLVMNSDIFSNINLEDLFLAFEKENADMAVASVPYSVDIPYAVMELKKNNIISFKEKPTNTYFANAGIYLIKAEKLPLIPKNAFYNATDLMEIIMARKGKLIHNPITGYWIDIGKMDDYNKAKDFVKHI